MAGDWSIGEMARRCDTSVQTIRHYERLGLLAPPPRTAGNQRRYDKRELDRLRFIRHARELGFGIGDIRDLLRLAAHLDAPCDGADAIATNHLRGVESRIARLEDLRAALVRMVRDCRHGRIATCRIIEVLADHDLCGHDHPPAS